MSNPPTANPLYQPDAKLPQMQAQTHAPPPSHVAVHTPAPSVVANNGTTTGTTPNPIGIPAVAAPIIPPSQNIVAGASVTTVAAPGATMVSAVSAPPVAAVSTTATGAPVAPPQPKEEYEEIREQDRYLPIANIARIMKNTLPENAKIAKDSKETVQECVSEFISFITSEASDKCMQEKRKTINGDDLLWAMSTLGFDKYVEPLKIYLGKYREAIRGDKPDSKGGSGGGSHLGRPPATAASVGAIGLPGGATSVYQAGVPPN